MRILNWLSLLFKKNNITVGMIAEENAQNMSQEQKDKLWQQHHEYLFNKEGKPLPEGMTPLPGTIFNRIASTEQRKTDPKYARRHTPMEEMTDET